LTQPPCRKPGGVCPRPNRVEPAAGRENRAGTGGVYLGAADLPESFAGAPPKQNNGRPAKAGGGSHSRRRRGGQCSGADEFANVARNKLRHEWASIEYALNQFRLSFDAIWPLTLSTHAAAVALARNHHPPFYDALIVASAIEAGCDTLCSEDMQDGRVIGGLITRNGFAETSRILSPSTICSWRAAQLPGLGRAFQNS
jgi:hypothetical protein